MGTTPKIVELKPLANFRLWVRYDDGSQGEVDFVDLAGRGVFSAWEKVGAFESVTIGPHGELVWRDEIEICGDAVYMRLTGKVPEEVFAALKKAAVDA